MSKILILFLVLVSTGLYAQYPGTNVRGQIMTSNPYGQQVPLVSAKVDLFVFNPQFQQLQYLATSYTDGYGFFFFNGLPVNNYVINVNGARSYNINVIPIDYNYYRFQDLGVLFF